MKFDITQGMRAVHDFVETLTNPRHRAIIQNYRRHAILELSGQWEQILAPEMTVAEPVYRFHKATGYEELIGMQAVRKLYASLVETGVSVAYQTDIQILVNDWGFATEYKVHRYTPGRVLIAAGERIDDPNATYLVSAGQAMFWPYDEEGKMKEERVFRGSDRSIKKLHQSEVITVEECLEKLMPLIPAAEECSYPLNAKHV